MSEAVTVLSLKMRTSIVSEKSLARDTRPSLAYRQARGRLYVKLSDFANKNKGNAKMPISRNKFKEIYGKKAGDWAKSKKRRR